MSLRCMRCVNASILDLSEIQRFERNDAIEIRNGIIFDFYTGLSRMLFQCIKGTEICIRYYLEYVHNCLCVL